MAMTPQDWTISGLSVELGVDRRTLAKRLADVTPVREDGKSQYYRMKDAVAAVYQSGDDTGSYEQERTRLTKAQADKTELEVSVLRGDLIPAEIVDSVWGSMLGAFRARCLSIPTKAAHAILAVADLHEAETILKDHVHEALTELADYDATQYGVKAGQESLAGDSATSRDDGEPVGGCVPATQQRGKRRARKMEH
jgi:phage terminase Nu1 subunit (DNA packaging protein)